MKSKLLRATIVYFLVYIVMSTPLLLFPPPVIDFTIKTLAVVVAIITFHYVFNRDGGRYE